MQFRERPRSEATYQALLDAGIEEPLANIASRRMDDPDQAQRSLLAGLGTLDSYAGLADIDVAAQAIADVIERVGEVVLSTDHDADGCSSAAVLHSALTRMGLPAERIRMAISHKQKEGYGLNESLCDRILAMNPKPDLVITADNGSSDEPRIARLKAAGIPVIVTDHHMLAAEGPPASALAMVSPLHPDSTYPDPTIAGVMVAWLVMCATRARMIETGKLPADTPKFGDLLAYVALGTQADCVSLSSPNNRAVMRVGLKQMRQFAQPCWRSLRQLSEDVLEITSELLSFQVCPRLASAGRLDDALPGIQWLLAQTDEEADQLFSDLTRTNEERKQIQQGMVERLMPDAKAAAADGVPAIVLYDPDGHPGCQGIVASRVLEETGLTAVVLSPHPGDPEMLTGSVRASEAAHARDALQAAHESGGEGGLLYAFGGHRAAAGLKVRIDNLSEFAEYFVRAVRAQVKGQDASPVLEYDRHLPPEDVTIDTATRLGVLEPFGQAFPEPRFRGTFEVINSRLVGQEKNHLSLQMKAGGRQIRAIWFRATESNPDVAKMTSAGQMLDAVYQIKPQYWRGARQLNVIINHAQLASTA